MNSSSPFPHRHGFTLVEMLVAVSILSFMLVMMSQMIGSAQLAFRLAQNRIDNFTRARSMLDLIANDLQRAVFRGDLPIFGTGVPSATGTATNSGLYYFTNTKFINAFYTRMPAASGTSSQVRDVSLVSYALTGTTGEDKTVLQRSDLNVPWTGSQNIAFQGDIAPQLQNATAREVAPGVVGFRLIFRRADGSLIDQSQYTGYNAANPVVGVDLGLAVIANQSLVLLSKDQITQIQSALANESIKMDPLSNAPMNNGIKAVWDQQVLTASFYSPYPKNLGYGLKTFERWVACPAF